MNIFNLIYLIPTALLYFLYNLLYFLLSNSYFKSIQTATTNSQTLVSNIEHRIYKFKAESIKDYFGDVDIVTLVLPNSNDGGPFRAKGVPFFDVLPVILPMKYLKCTHNQNESFSLRDLDTGIACHSKYIETVLPIDEE